MNKGLFLAGSILAMAGFSGCAHMEAVTEVQPDGNWTRTDSFRQPKTSGPMDIGGQLSDVYVLPEGSPWKIQKSAANDEVAYTAMVKLEPGAELRGDVRVREQKGKEPAITNSATVTRIAPGRYRYREVLRWTGPRPEGFPTDKPDPDLSRALLQALPASVRSDASARRIALEIQRSLVRVIFGPDENLLPQAMFQPATIERVLRRAVGRNVERALATEFGEKLSSEERRQTVIRVTRSMAAAAGKQTGPMKESAPGANGGKGDSLLSTLTFTLRVPGKVTRTNGEVDEYTNEVWWTMYSPAVSMGDIVLEAEWEVPTGS